MTKYGAEFGQEENANSVCLLAGRPRGTTFSGCFLSTSLLGCLNVQKVLVKFNPRCIPED